MTTYYAPSTKGFYISDINGTNIPNDSIEIPDSLRLELLNNQSNGIPIGLDSNGYPASIPKTTEQLNSELSQSIRIKRNSLLQESDWTQLPDIPQTIKDAWAIYRQNLRNIPQQSDFPTNVIWPTAPQ